MATKKPAPCRFSIGIVVPASSVTAAALASGSMARTSQTPGATSCGPKTPNGSPCSAATIAATARSPTVQTSFACPAGAFGPRAGFPGSRRRVAFQPSAPSFAIGRSCAQDRKNAPDRRFDPVRPVVRLVVDLVERLGEEMQPQQALARGAVFDAGRAALGGFLIGIEEGGLNCPLPRSRRGGDARRRLAEALRHLARDGLARIGEGAQHAGDIAQGRGLGAPLFRRARRLALEIDDRDV